MAESPQPVTPSGRLSRSALARIGESTARQESIFGGTPRIDMGPGESTVQGPADSFWIRIDAVGTNGQYAATEVARAFGQPLGTLDQPPGDARTWTLTDNPVYEANLSTAVKAGEIHRAWNSGSQGTIEFDAGGSGSQPTPPTPADCATCFQYLCFNDGVLSYFDGNGNLIPVPTTCVNPFFNAAGCLTCNFYHGSTWNMPKQFHATLFTPNCAVTNGLVVQMNWNGPPGPGLDGCSWSGTVCAKSLDCSGKYDPRYPTCDCYVSLTVSIAAYGDFPGDRNSFQIYITLSERYGDGAPCTNGPGSVGGSFANIGVFSGSQPCPQPIPFTTGPLLLYDGDGNIQNDFVAASSEPDCWTGCTGPITAVFST